MKRMQKTDLRRSIRHTKVSFIAMILFVALSIGYLLGMRWTGPAVNMLANDYYDRYGAADFIVSSAEGFKDEDIEDVKAAPEVIAAEGIETTDAIFYGKGERNLIHISTVSSDVNRPEILEGSLPDQSDEIALDVQMAEEFGYGIGDKISINSSMFKLTGYDVSMLKENKLTVSALVHHPLYIAAVEGSSKGYSPLHRKNYAYYALVDESAFDERIHGDNYDELLVQTESLKGLDRFSDGYSTYVTSSRENIRKSCDASEDWLFTEITSTFGYYYLKVAGDTGSKVGGLLGAFFFIFGLLVAFSTVLRIVQDEAQIIGTKLANGFTRKAVTAKYIRYTSIAVLIGSVLGIGTAFFVSIVGQINTSALMVFSGTRNYYDPVQIVVVIVIEFLAMALATWIASARQIRRGITRLLTDSKENSRLFMRISSADAIRKVSTQARSFLYNLSIDSTRVLATIVGIVGCIALLVGPISLYGISDTARVQYEEIFLFDHSISYNSADAEKTIDETLNTEGAPHIFVRSEDAILSRDNEKSGQVKLIIAEDAEKLAELVKLRDPGTGKSESLDNEGVWIYQSESRDYGTKEGDTLSLGFFDGGEYKFKVGGVYENHDSSSYRIFMTADAYEKATSKDFKTNSCLAAVAEDTAEKLKTVDGVLDCSNERKNCEDSTGFAPELITGMVSISIFLSALIAFLILLNLNIQFVQEKKTELIVMRINGFSIRKARMYIIRDSIFLSVIACVLGVIVGILFSRQLINALQMEGQVFVNRPSPVACLTGVVITMIYMLITTVIAVKPVSGLKLTDINKQ